MGREDQAFPARSSRRWIRASRCISTKEPWRNPIIHPSPSSLFDAGPAVTIVDDRNVSIREAVFKQGALIRLVCLVRQADRESFPVQWRLGPAQVFNHDTQRGGVSVKTERQGRDAISWLLMVRATSRDSGLYTCSVDGRSHANVSVHVIQGRIKDLYVIFYRFMDRDGERRGDAGSRSGVDNKWLVVVDFLFFTRLDLSSFLLSRSTLYRPSLSECCYIITSPM